MKILAFGASPSKHSINKKLARFVSGLFKNGEVTLLDLNDFEMPIFSVDREHPINEKALAFAKYIDETDLIVMSLAENNGNYSAAFKNLYDWVSRIPNRKIFNGKKVLLLSTSPGGRGGSSVMEIALKRFPFDGAVIVGSMSLPSFNQNFSEETGITNPEYLSKVKELVQTAGGTL
ncbi:MAG: NAD(P)H-dependent oxidoreductase [Bdellovibrionota bacterium]